MVGMVGVLSGPFVVGRSSTNAPGVSGISGASVARRGVVERGLRPPARPRASARRSPGVIVKSQISQESSRSFAGAWNGGCIPLLREKEKGADRTERPSGSGQGYFPVGFRVEFLPLAATTSTKVQVRRARVRHPSAQTLAAPH